MFNLAHIHEAIAARVPERECLVFRDRRFRWRETTDRTRRLADVLTEFDGNLSDAVETMPYLRARFDLALVEAFSAASFAELDYRREAENARRFARDLVRDS